MLYLIVEGGPISVDNPKWVLEADQHTIEVLNIAGVIYPCGETCGEGVYHLDDEYLPVPREEMKAYLVEHFECQEQRGQQ